MVSLAWVFRGPGRAFSLLALSWLLACSGHGATDTPKLRIEVLSVAPSPLKGQVEVTLELVNNERFAVVYPGLSGDKVFAWFERHTWRGWRVPGFVCDSDLRRHELEAGGRRRFTMNLPDRGTYRVVLQTDWNGTMVSRPIRHGVLFGN